MSATRPHRPVLGVSLKLASVVMLSSMSACVKFLGTDMPMGETIFVRSLIAVITLALIARFTVGMQVLKTDHWQRHARRSLFGTISMFCLFTALTLIPLADVTVIGFTSPMFVTVLAMLFLGERIHAFRWTALGIGLVGVLIMISPHLHLGSGQTLGLSAAFAATLFSAIAMIFLRRMSGAEHAITITFYFMLTSMACALLTLPWGWIVPDGRQLLVLLMTGAFGVLGQLLLSFSYRYAEASTIAPLDYSSMIMAVLLGYLFFAELPNWSIWFGAPLVMASGLIIFWREYRLQLLRLRDETA
ncbi:MAG: DMT family transporter [Steroidobacteraceae bacterium]